MEKIKVGDKVMGFMYDEVIHGISYYNPEMDKHIGEIGEVTEVGLASCTIQFKEDFWAYPLEEAIEHLVKPKEDYNQYIGRKMQAFEFPEIYKGTHFNESMQKKAKSLELGEILSVQNRPNVTYGFHVQFPDGDSWSYPCELAIPYIINGEDNTEHMEQIVQKFSDKADALEHMVRLWQAEHVKPDMVNSPAHYGAGVYELCNVLEAYGFQNELWLGQALQYIVRYNKKGHTTDSMIEDLEKAIWNINRKIKLLKEGK